MGIQTLSQGTPTSASQVPFYDPDNGVDRRCSVADLQAAMGVSAVAGPVTQYASPGASAFSITIAPPTDGDSMFLLVKPLALYAAGTLVLPTGVDGQEVIVHYAGFGVTALTVTPAAGESVSGAPTTMAAGAFFRLRFDEVNNLWCRIG